MLKNWTVTTQPVRNGSDGIMVRERYLLAQNHSNHRNTESIISLLGNAKTSQKIALIGEQFRVNQHLSSKGGRPLSSYAMEYCLTLPKKYRPTEGEWKLILADCCLALAQLCQLKQSDMRQFKSQIRAVLHRQNQDCTLGAGDHVHLILGKVVSDKVLKPLQQKKGTKILKSAFNASVLRHLGVDHKEYKPYELNRGKRLETWKYHQNKAYESLHLEKLILKMQKQADKWFEAQKEHNKRQMNRQLNRLIQTFEELSDLDVPQCYQEELNDLKATIGLPLQK
ncbi:TPA: hypothetical protein GRR58_22080 [Vibrio parahaemolyticus]|uniref:hypothetical protein n=1 Tax=Vibrio parahaemolyticus TaxID=670 RepID=UPI001A1938EA|nr:hypothetical protein [Vibrio parahaemolyticus]EGQ8008891.1 hypothetical protein [Vibrio parahaemolyticus]EHK2868923.1 hypothetical protein [Vibrio parahaemolyticus]EJG0673739.1 hypothetical protein [Vibrio parahaemolyticus]ELA9534656.1 hypothetical protein [Vibrio parahaemolyticus]MCC3817769.1 hypothetical protein [Vibrio parahaemolyticus]